MELEGADEEDGDELGDIFGKDMETLMKENVTAETDGKKR